MTANNEMDIIQEAKEYLSYFKDVPDAERPKGLDLISRLVDRLEWRPIESAPKDGTRFISIIKGFHPTVSWWNGTFFTSDVLENFIENDKEYLYFCDGMPSQPTHWLPFHQQEISK